MWTSTAASGFGDRMIMLAALALLGGLTMSAESTALTAATQFWFFLPYLGFSLLGGWLADRLPRKWVMLGCDETRGLILLWAYFALAAASGLAVLPEDRWWQVYAVLAAAGACAAVFNPSRTAIVPQIVNRDQLQPANAVVLVINVAFSMIGMVIGTRIISQDDATSVRTGLLIGALFYLVSGTFFAFMKPRTTGLGAGGSNVKRLAVGPGKLLRYVFTHKRVLSLILAELFVWGVAATSVASSIMGLCKVRYGLAGDELFATYGMLSATLGVGMLVGAALVVLIRTRKEATLVITLAFVGAGLAAIAYVAIPVLWVSYATLLLIGVCGNVAFITMISMLQSLTPDYIRGSVIGLSALVTTAVTVLVYFAIWKLPNADTNILIVVWGLGPLMIAIGLAVMVYYTRTGPYRVSVNWPMHFVRLYMYSYHRLRQEGKQHVPTTGRAIIAPNHVTGIDGLCVQSPLQRMIRWLMIADYKTPWLNFIWNGIEPIALERDKPASTQVRQIVKVLKQDELVTIFPEGTLQREDRRLRPFQQGVVTIARLSRSPIIPAWIHGGPMYHSMLMHAVVPSRSRIVFGPALTLDRNVSVDDANAQLRRRILALGRYVHFDECNYTCPSCHADLEETYAGDANECPECGHVIFDTTPGPFQEGTFGIDPGSGEEE